MQFFCGMHGQAQRSGRSISSWSALYRASGLTSRQITCEGLVGNEVIGHLFSPQLDRGLAIGQGISLGKEVAHELVMVGDNLALHNMAKHAQSG